MNDAYEIIEKRRVADLNSEGYLLRHKRTGARVFILSNDDENKVFYIGFRTPPYDSTGLPHILEHSVLCGSKKYPVKDPFVELCKGSLNTFLNAMTYPDKTVYPVASCNDKDFANLMDVYLDAVFHPNIYEREEIFRQEGWRYELEEVSAEIKLNGVVYNEMKGAFSTPDDMLDREIFSTLFPDTAYGVESGGDPDVIPELTYEKFLEFHGRYYHPSNSYIYLYGNIDIDERLEYLDREYLSKYEAAKVDSQIKMQEPFSEIVKVEKSFSVTADEPLEDNTYMSYNVVIDTALNRELYLAFQVIDYCLIGAPGACITERLLKSGLVNDVDAIYENGILQPYYSITAKGGNKENLDEFLSIIKDELEKVVKNGLDKDMIRAAINIFEFKYREADFGRYPKGLMYGLQCMDSWLYDESNPFMHIEANETYTFLKKQVETDYFEKLIEKYLLNNGHSSIVTLVPERSLTAKKEKELADKLSEYKKTLSNEEIEALVEKTKALKLYQEEPSTQEELEKIPLLEISDIKKEARKYIYKENDVNGTKVITHDIFTNGIGYITAYFDINRVPKQYLSYVGILSNVLGFLNTENHTYTELTNEININTGGISTSVIAMQDYVDIGSYRIMFKVRTKVLYDKIPNAFELMKELIIKTDFSDTDRLLELLQMIKSRMQPSIISAGHSTAFKRAMSYISEADACHERFSGIDFYRLLCTIIDNYDEKKEELVNSLRMVTKFIFREENLIIDFIGEREGQDKVMSLVEKFKHELIEEECVAEDEGIKLAKLNEGFKTGAKVQYVAKVGNYRKAGLDHTGALDVLKVIMGYDYLWNNIRVKGGAYGCMSGFTHTGNAYFVSYRDPNLKETLDIYNNAANYISSFECSDRDMTKFIIGTIADMDAPLTPYDEGISGFAAYMTHKTDADLQKVRDEVLSCKVETIRGLSKYLTAIINENAICVVGAEEKILENKELFGTITDLL